jgi:fibronectin-binding autotransporter adhesin
MKHDTSSRQTKVFHSISTATVCGFLYAIALGWLPISTYATVRNWTGNSSGYWSNPNNWDPVGFPQVGDFLQFGYVSDSNRSMVNDLADLTVISLDFQINDYDLAGNSITLTANVLPLNVGGGIQGTLGYSYASHSTTINCPLIFANGGVVLVGGDVGAFTSDTDNLYLNGPMTLGGDFVSFEAFTDYFASGGFGHIYISGSISGPSNTVMNLYVAGGSDSSVEFIGPQVNTFNGPVNLGTDSNSQIVFNKSSGLVVNNRLTVHYGMTARLQLAGQNQIASDATILIDVGGQLLLSGNNASIGSLVLSNSSADAVGSTLDTGSVLLGLNGGIIASVDNDHVHPTIKGRLNLVGFGQFDISGGPEPGLEIQAAVGGNGFQKVGPGSLRLSGNNNYSGDVEVIAGAIEAFTSTAFGQAGPNYGVHLEGGNVTLQGVAIGAEPLFVNSAVSVLNAINQCSWAGPVTLNTSLNVVPVDATFSNRTMDFSGPINGSGGLNLLPAIFGVGGVRLIGPMGNLFTGPTVVGCSLLQLGKPSGVNAYAGPLVVGNPGGSAICETRWLSSYQNVGATATLYANGIININNHTEDFGPITFNGGEIDTGTGTFNIYAPLTVNPSPSGAVINGYLGLPPGDNRVIIVGDGASDCDLLVNAVVFGSPGTYFVKQGAGTMCLANTNTFNTATLLEEGIIDINNSSGLGTWAGLVIFDGATLRLSGSGSGGGFEGIGAGVGGTHGAIEVPPNASWTLGVGMLLDGPTTFNVGLGGALTLNAAISSSGPNCSVIKTGSGDLRFTGGTANSYSGDTIVSAGQCYLAKGANVLSVPGNLTIGPGSAGPVLVRLFQPGGIGGSTVTVNANSLFDLNGYSMSLAQLNLRDGGNVQTVGGTLSFPSGGSVNVGSQSLFGSHAASTISGFLGLPISGTVTVNVSPAAPTPPLLFGPELEVTAAIGGAFNHGGAGTLVKEGLGQMRLSGNSTFPGDVSINAGAVIAAHANALGTTFRGTTVYNGAQLVLEGGINIAGEYIGLDSTNAMALESRNGINTLGGLLYLNRNSRMGPSSLADGLMANGQIDGPGALTKVGLGTLTLGGSVNNTFAGETFVNQGTLLLNKPNGVTAVPGALEVGAVDDSTAATVGNLGSYQIVGNIYVHSRGIYDINGQQENTDALVMYGSGVVRTGAGYLSLKTGAPISVYPGSNTTATINGNLFLDPGNHLITVASGATAPGVQDLLINAAISQTSTAASIQKEGPGRMRLVANNTYTGATTVNGGTLQIDGSQSQSAVTVSNATLQGSGTVGPVSFAGTSGIIAPGASPGILTCGNFNAGALGSGTLQIEINGTTPGSGYDQINAQGTVTLTGIKLSPTLGFASSANDQFTIIQNDGSDAVVGTFTGLPQGTNLYIGGERFQITYTGGTGNDVVLTRLVTPPKPILTIERVPPASVRLLWTTNDPAYLLQFNTNLASSNWVPAGPAPVILGTNYVVTNAIVGATRFYRLIK